MLKRTYKRAKKLAGFTLAEMLIVLIIIGILVSLALPQFLPLITKTKSVEAKLQLNHVLQMEKTFFFLNSKYSSNLIEIGFEQSKLVSDGGKANYKIEISESTNKGFIAKATAITDFDADGTYNVWQTDQSEDIKEITPD